MWEKQTGIPLFGILVKIDGTDIHDYIRDNCYPYFWHANEDPATGETLLTPTVHNKDAFLTMMDAPDDPGFDIRNVMVVFDDHEELALIRRYYVPWQ